ncbi:MAG: hypothetical protein RIS71_905, partial [Actinomycetota bacterium]
MFGVAEFVGSHHDGDPATAFLFDDVVHQSTARYVETGGGFIQEEHVGLTGKYLCELSALLLTARQVAQWEVRLGIDS